MWKLSKEMLKEFRDSEKRGECANIICTVCDSKPGPADGPEWAESWGHRCKHNEPCPSFNPVSEEHSVCQMCVLKVEILA